MSTSRIEIIRRAASATGNGPLQSLDENDDVARLVDEHYESLVETALTSHAWRFARRVNSLSRLAGAVEAPWGSLWLLPPDVLSLHLVHSLGGVRVDHEERETPQGKAVAVFDQPSSLLATYTSRVAEDRWPADFAKSIQYRLEAVFLAAVAEQRSAADAREAMAEALQQRARARDGRASTSPDPREWDLAAARRRSAAWDYRRG